METKPYHISEEMRKKLREPFPAEAYQAHGSKSFLPRCDKVLFP
ncbi:hypothetical protein ES703_70201 [subsurface metagenome]